MKAYVITLPDHEKSAKVADRCIASGAKNNLTIEKFYGFTPKDNPRQMFSEQKMSFKNFDEKYCKSERAMAAFLSHRELWKKSVSINQPIAVFEHDAVMVNSFPNVLNFDKVMTFSKPSYGKYNTPTHLGVGPLVQKPYFGGAHGYIVSPSGARKLLELAQYGAGPTDVFLHIDSFPWLQEYAPWICEARDSFTTIQRTTGCLAKHNYTEAFEIIS